MDVKPEDFKFTPKETAGLLATVVLTGLAIAALIAAVGKKKDKQDD